MNFSSIIFIIIYSHIIKGIIFSSFNKFYVWVSGWIIIILIIIVSFLGYVLPWGQIRLWGATVITNLLSAVPLIGKSITELIWGGYFVSNITMKLFFRLHFIIPFIIAVLILIHLVRLHYYSSSRPLGSSFITKLEFSPIYIWKDLVNGLGLLVILWFLFFYPYYLSDAENFIEANPLVSPIHIQPEWYFLQYYAVLRRIPSKLGGVIIFVLSLVIILLMFLVKFTKPINDLKMWNIICSIFIVINICLIWLGKSPVESPYLFVSQVITVLYFFYFLIIVSLYYVLYYNKFKTNNLHLFIKFVNYFILIKFSLDDFIIFIIFEWIIQNLKLIKIINNDIMWKDIII